MKIKAQIRLMTNAMVMVSIGACQGARPTNLGPHNGQLASCPDRPNCVSTAAAEDSQHKIDPLPLRGTPKESLTRLKSIISQMPRTQIITDTPHYVHASSESLIFRFVDDLEIYLPEGADSIALRSASRLGYSDLGVNRQRCESLRQAYLAL